MLNNALLSYPVVGGDSTGSKDKSKGGLSKESYIIIGACAGVLALLMLVLIVYKKCGKKHGGESVKRDCF
jgi:hypothetical protein